VKTLTLKKSLVFCVIFLLIVLKASVNYAQTPTISLSEKSGKNLSVSLSGGVGSSGHHMNTDLNAELLLAISNRSSLGLGIGYIFAGDPMTMHHHTDNLMDENSDHGHSFSILPVSLTFHYRLPVNEKFSVSLKGGGGFYAGWFSNAMSEQSSAFGPHAGIGFDNKITRGISLLAEGYYRSVLLNEFNDSGDGDSHGMMDDDDHMDDEDGHMGHHGSHDEMGESFYHDKILHDENDGSSSFQSNVNLKGFVFRVGIRFDI
jgi:hypothetical protein